jgi:hypothetical protein
MADEMVDSEAQSVRFVTGLNRAGNFTRTVPITGAPHYWISEPLDEPHSYTGYATSILCRLVATERAAMIRPVKNLDAIEALDYALGLVRDHTLSLSPLDRQGLDKHRRVTETLTDLRVRFDQEHSRESFQLAQRHSTAHSQQVHFDATRDYGPEAGPRHATLAHQVRIVQREVAYEDGYAQCSCGWTRP